MTWFVPFRFGFVAVEEAIAVVDEESFNEHTTKARRQILRN